MMCWTVGAQTLHFVKLGTLKPDTPTVPVVLVTFVSLMGLVHRHQEARFVWGSHVYLKHWLLKIFEEPQ